MEDSRPERKVPRAHGIRIDGFDNLIVKNNANDNGSQDYLIAGGNRFAATSTAPSTAGCWANFGN
jgi:hypothetical protein